MAITDNALHKFACSDLQQQSDVAAKHETTNLYTEPTHTLLWAYLSTYTVGFVCPRVTTSATEYVASAQVMCAP